MLTPEQKEPLSRSLKGRPFEYEDFYEILFPDVIGTGGAPKRVTARKRKAESSVPGDADQDQTALSADGTPGPAMAVLSEATYNNNGGGGVASASSSTTTQQGQQAQAVQRQSTASAAPTTSPVAPQQHHTQQQTQRPTSTTLPPRSSLTSVSVLTPPDEVPQATRQRFMVPEHSSQPPPPSSAYQPPPRPNSGPDKRRKGKADGYLNIHPPRPQPLPHESYHHHPSHQGHTIIHHHSPTSASYPPLPPSPRAQAQIDGILALAEAIRQTQRPPKPAFTEQAVEIFLDNFADEDKDFQIKIADKLFADEHKSMVFVKMSEELRTHWVKRMKDVHFKQT